MKKTMLLVAAMCCALMMSSCKTENDKILDRLEEAVINEDEATVYELTDKLEVLDAKGELSEKEMLRFQDIVSMMTSEAMEQGEY